ncbi:MAG: N-6 DNA methylase [Planctomycetaceae bacterium]|jgi:cell division protein FtsB|nr:N-6 DNA methylase [Planctomycetaceae bacterium]
MTLTPQILTPRQALNKSFLKQKLKPTRTGFDRFRNALVRLLDNINNSESEEFHKNLIAEFLAEAYYKPDHFINTKDRNDLVIHNGNKADSSIGVIFEVKSPSNKNEMVSVDNLNTKAFQELILYYLRERITHKNIEIKHLIITNVDEWFIFDATTFEQLFAQNKELVKRFIDFEEKRLLSAKTDFFYTQIAKPFIDTICEIEFAHFNLRDYEKNIRNISKENETKLIPLFKIFTPEHLLKLPFANDCNTLDSGFYNELLHILGLTETVVKGKVLIKRNNEQDRNSASVLEETITQLDSLAKLERLKNPSHYGKTEQERLFNVALQLSLMWVDRILFIKLLEAQLLSFNDGDKEFLLISLTKIKNYDELNNLFFQVLAKKTNERNKDVQNWSGKIPYLNSSLFEPTELEQETIFINSLTDNKTIPILSTTILKDRQGKKRTGKLPTLEYLFEFLNAYDFGSEGVDDIQEEDKPLISASVLGLIFEKINGYKDGSFFTPGYITMYMCRETIRNAVIRKFNTVHHWDCKSIDEIRNKMNYYDADIKSANAVVNSIKICDPAVGSGHFLVSALNEMIAVKQELGILTDRNGRRLRFHNIQVVNDELLVTDIDDGKLYEYKRKNHAQKRSIQEAIFHEKQTIIENCLFGVDVNPNSVQICRLRLWIELLKNAYYKNGTELETLPNLDINIKCGDSLVSRFSVDADITPVLKKHDWTIERYRNAVASYRCAKSREEKSELTKLIAAIKSDFQRETPWKLLQGREKILSKHYRDLHSKNHPALFNKRNEKQHADLQKTIKQIKEEITKLETEIAEIKSNTIYENAFEWRFEFPEVLNNDGEFLGFDVVIANPPYLNIELMDKKLKDYYKTAFSTFYKRSDTFNLFTDLSYSSLCPSGFVTFIVPSIVLTNLSFKPIRDELLKTRWLRRVCYTGEKVFSKATVDTVILFIDKTPSQTIELINALDFSSHKKTIVAHDYFTKFNNVISISSNKKSNAIFDKIFKPTNINIELHFDIFQGIVTGNNPVFIFDEPQQWKSLKIERKLLKPVLHGRDFHKWIIKNTERKILYLDSKSNIEDYPNTKQYLLPFKNELSKRRECVNDAIPWFSLQWARNRKSLETLPKIIVQNTRNERLKPRIVATVDEIGFFGSQGLNFIVPKTKDYSIYFLIGIINSKLINYIFATKFLNLAIKADFIKQLSFPKPSKQQIVGIEKLSKKILAQKTQDLRANTADLETQIDRLVYEIYGLTSSEVETIEKF